MKQPSMIQMTVQQQTEIALGLIEFGKSVARMDFVNNGGTLEEFEREWKKWGETQFFRESTSLVAARLAQQLYGDPLSPLTGDSLSNN